MLATESPFPQYFDLDGTPLNNGSLYFGVANQNPETNPITVYWDAAGTQPAAQPIPTINGYAVRNGSAAFVYANSDYSLSVKSREASLIFYSASAAAASNAFALQASGGAALVGYENGTAKDVLDSIKPMANYTALRAYTGVATGVRITSFGVAGVFQRDDSDTTSSDNGGTVIIDASARRWKRQFSGALDVRWFGAVHNTNSTVAIQAVFDFIRASGSPHEVDLGEGNIYKISSALRGCQGLHIRGASILLADAGFAIKTFTNFNGGTVDIRPVLYFNENDTLYNPTNPRRYGVSIGEEVTINCNFNADYCVITDNYFDMDIRGKFQRANKWGFRTFFFGWGNRVRPYISHAIEGGVWLGDGCNGVDLDGLVIFGDSQRTLLGVLSDGNNNGVHWAGGYCEKVVDAVRLRNNAGPMKISGVDFEDITGKAFEVDGTGTTGRLAGPLTLDSCFLESSTAGENLVTATNANVIVSGCRGRGKSVNVNAFSTSSGGVIDDVDNEFESTVTTRYAQFTRVNRKSGRAFVDHGYAQATNSTNTAREIYNFAYTYSPALVTSGIDFSHVITDVPTQRMVGSSTWFMADMSGGAESNRMGVSLAYTGGGTNKRFTPIDDNLTDLGFSTARWKVVYAGTGTINTSDEREKQDIATLDAAEMRVATILKGLVKKFRFRDAVHTKGDGARIHVGVIAQEVVSAFRAEGLDPMRYGIICYDEWDAEAEKLDEAGKVVSPARSAGNRYGIRYEELFAFIISSI